MKSTKEKEIQRVYSKAIFERGFEYFKEGRVLNAIEFKEKLFGEVVGTVRYRTEVDLDGFESKCSCPYGRNCKHGVALLLQYFNGEYIDGDEIMKRLEGMDKEELGGVIEKLISMNPESLLYLGPYQTGKEKTSEKRIKSLDKEIRSRLRRVEYTYADADFVDDFAKFIKINEDALTKEHIFYILEFLIENSEEYGYFYDDYLDSYFGDAIFENLCDAFAKKELREEDFERLNELMDKDDYDMLDSFISRMVAAENAIRLKDFDGYINEFLDERSYIEFLVNCGLVEKARKLIETETYLDEESRFRLYLRIDRDDAVEFARKKRFYPSLMRYYHEIGAHDEAVGLFKEVVTDKQKKKQLKGDRYLYGDILDSIDKSEKKDEMDKVLRSLFEVCYSFKYYGLCVDAGIRLGDKGLMRKLIDKESSYYFDTESKIKLLEYLSEEYREEVEIELKELAESLIKEKNNYAYEKATECVFLLREMMDKEEWEEYVKALYGKHSRKINLWSRFKKRGVDLRMKKGVVGIEVRR
ncbi:hypothetical protein ANME2D_00793 [Candidatus Methanoperedens nitroreducens]|uniref:SWIM-type domain-containing protein n=1 Tax=Candidatus Methanoperedens nitratireducens TaxID=1392998 RepID=A0A062UZL7_9EURY|nr:SWIM zinc finger family protein [Candidatus Methanoperedens nitroreducens]KCZ72366.1 hypothetical protein ANME2D_00793 [Candidatus Methanoperedens nitroreducens]MDJ1423701.1 SWIM zinc finger family protein [Candidatus Methanoperedens sp.]